jgi:hypothetical protein
MSKTARRCRVRAIRSLRQHPAILPWLSSPLLIPGRRFLQARARFGSFWLPYLQRMNFGHPLEHARRMPRNIALTANTKLIDQRFIARFVRTLEVIEQLPPL